MAKMNVTQWIERLKYIAANRKTSYNNKFPANCGLIYSDGSISFDCIGLVKSLINDPDIYKRTTPAGYYAVPGTNIADTTEIGILKLCSSISYKFTDLRAGDYLYKSGHGGVYVGDFTDSSGVVNVVECTVGWGANGVITSYVDSQGYRYNHKGGTNSGKWEAHGSLAKYINYTDTTISKGEVVMKPADSVAILIRYLPDVKLGSKNTTVKMLQEILKKYGWYTGLIDSYCGSMTVKGIKLMQTALGVTVDGYAGQETYTKLFIG